MLLKCSFSFNLRTLTNVLHKLFWNYSHCYTYSHTVFSHIWMLFTGTLSVQSKEVQMKEAIMLSLNHVPKTSMVDCKKK